MSLEKIKAVTAQILNRLAVVRGKGEQATKQSLVIPMIDALGYDIWNPLEVCPEYDADFAIKKAGQKEKVDIAILLSGIPRIFIEVKPIDEYLDNNEGQLARYFNSITSVTLGVLTNGVEWRFFTDTGDPNIMDALPFHIVKIDSADQGLDVLARFAKAVFCPEAIRDYATELRYTAQVAEFLTDELDLKDREPSEYFVRWILKADKMYSGVVNANVIDRFRPITKAAITRVIRDIVRRSIIAMDQVAAQNTNAQPIVPQLTKNSTEGTNLCSGVEKLNDDNVQEIKPTIVTSDRELKAFGIIKNQFEQSVFSKATIFDASTRKDVPISIAYKDTTGYFGIYFNKPSWWIIRVVIESKKPWIGFNVDEVIGKELIPEGMVKLDAHPYADFRVAINTIDDLDRLNRLIFKSFEKVINDKEKQKNLPEEDLNEELQNA
jgi:predicted type IV restriction endonuclease